MSHTFSNEMSTISHLKPPIQIRIHIYLLWFHSFQNKLYFHNEVLKYLSSCIKSIVISHSSFAQCLKTIIRSPFLPLIFPQIIVHLTAQIIVSSPPIVSLSLSLTFSSCAFYKWEGDSRGEIYLDESDPAFPLPVEPIHLVEMLSR